MQKKPIYSYNTRGRHQIKDGRKQKINISAKGKQTESKHDTNTQIRHKINKQKPFPNTYRVSEIDRAYSLR